MNKQFMERFFANEQEKPLENMVQDGGMCRIFRTIGVVGDSLSSGKFELTLDTGELLLPDRYEYSWGQHLARNCGCKVYNFSRGGMTAKWFLDSYADEHGFWKQAEECQAFIMALGVNDLNGRNQELGSIGDIDRQNPDHTPDTYAGYYGRIIQRLKAIQPKAKFFLMTTPAGHSEKPAMNKLLYEMAALFDYTYVIDLEKYAPVYDEHFKARFFLEGHMNPAGYILTAQMVTSYIDYIIRHNMEDFHKVGFIGTEHDNVGVHW